MTAEFWVNAPKRGRCFRCGEYFKTGELVWTYRQYSKRTSHYYGKRCGCADKEALSWVEHERRMAAMLDQARKLLKGR